MNQRGKVAVSRASTVADTSTSENGSGSASVKSALRVLLILELLTDEPAGLTFAQICARLGLPKSSTYALLRTMKDRGHLDLVESGCYRIGIRIWQAAQARTHGFDLAALARPHLRAARDELRETVQLAVLDGVENVYLAKEDCEEQRLVLQSRVGARLPAYATGLGKALLAGLDDSEVLARLSSTHLEAFTSTTIAEPAKLLKVLHEVRRCGFSMDHGEYTEGVVCVAVPVRDHCGVVTAAISVSVPDIRADRNFQKKAVEVLTREATGLSALLGHSESGAL